MVNLSANQPDLGCNGVLGTGTGASRGLGIWQGNNQQNNWSRDWSSSHWTATNGTATLNATGVDGAANTATTLTATSANATFCQNPGLGSVTRLFTVWIKSITVTGQILVSQDNLATTFAAQNLSASAFTLQPQGTSDPVGTGILQTTAAIPCVKIVNSGDSIIVDQANLNSSTPLAGPQPPFTVVGAHNLGAANDALSITLANVPAVNPNSFTVVGQFVLPWWEVVGGNCYNGVSLTACPANRGVFEVDQGSAAKAVIVRVQGGTSFLGDSLCATDGNGCDNDVNLDTIGSSCAVCKVRGSLLGNTNQLQNLVAPVPNKVFSFAASYDFASGNTAISVMHNGVGPTVPTTAKGTMSPGFTNTTFTRMLIGSASTNSASNLNGWLLSLNIYNWVNPSVLPRLLSALPVVAANENEMQYAANDNFLLHDIPRRQIWAEAR
jgi:hypothetical protein